MVDILQVHNSPQLNIQGVPYYSGGVNYRSLFNFCFASKIGKLKSFGGVIGTFLFTVPFLYGPGICPSEHTLSYLGVCGVSRLNSSHSGIEI